MRYSCMYTHVYIYICIHICMYRHSGATAAQFAVALYVLKQVLHRCSALRSSTCHAQDTDTPSKINVYLHSHAVLGTIIWIHVHDRLVCSRIQRTTFVPEYFSTYCYCCMRVWSNCEIFHTWCVILFLGDMGGVTAPPQSLLLAAVQGWPKAHSIAMFWNWPCPKNHVYLFSYFFEEQVVLWYWMKVPNWLDFWQWNES